MERKVDRERYQESIARLETIFRDVSQTVGEVSTWRCPYKSVQDRCTANFGCRNQVRNVHEGELFACSGSDKLDYRSAWEV